MKKLDKERVNEIQALHQQLIELQKQCETSTAQSKDSAVKARRLGEANKDLSRQCKQNSEATELLAAMNEQYYAQQADNDKLMAANADLSTSLQQQRVDGRQTSQKLKELEKEHKGLQKVYQTALANLQSHEAQEREFGATKEQLLADKQSLLQSMTSTQQQLNEAERKVRDATQQLGSLQNQLAQSEAESKDLHQQLTNVRVETTRITQELELRYQEQVDDLRHCQDELQLEREQTSRLQGEKTQLGEAVRESDASRRALKAAYQELEAERASMEISLRDMAAEIQASLLDASDLRDGLDKLEEENQDLEAQLGDAAQEASVLKSSIYDAQKHAEQLAEKLQLQSDLREDAEEKLEALHADLAALQDTHVQQVHELETNLEKHRADLDSSTAKCTNLESALQALHQQNSEANNAKKNLQAINQSARRDLEDLRKQIEEIQDHNIKLKDLVSDFLCLSCCSIL